LFWNLRRPGLPMKSDSANKGIENFLDFLASIKRLSPKTIEAYRRDLLDWNGLGLPLDIHHPPTKTKTQDVLSKHLELKLEKSSQSRKRSALRSFAHFASLYNEGWKALFTWVPGAESSDDLPRALSQEEVELLLKSEMGIKLEDFRNKALLELLYASGLRISEALGLEWNDIDFQQNLIRVLGKGSKERVIPFSPRAAYWLEEYKLRLAPGKKNLQTLIKMPFF
jgi:site-specific recombinase XerD